MRTTWLGASFFVALGLLAIGTVGVGDMQLFGKVQSVDVGFANLEGLRVGDDVRVNGVKRGKIKEVHDIPRDRVSAYPVPEGAPKARVSVVVRLDADVVLFQNAVFKVETAAALGGMVLSVDGGDPDQPPLDLTKPQYGLAVAQPLSKVAEMLSENASSMTTVLADLSKFSARVREGAEKESVAQALLGKDPVYLKLLEVLESSNRTMEAISSGKALGMDPESEVRKKLDAMIKEADAALAEARKTFEALNNKDAGAAGLVLNDPAFRAKVEKAVNDAGSSLEKVGNEVTNLTETLRAEKGALGKMIYNQKMGEDLQAAVEAIKDAAQNIEKMTQDAAAGKGTIGKLMKDDSLYTAAKGAVQGADELIGRMSRTEVRFDADYMHAFNKEYGTATVGVEYWPDRNKFFKVALNSFDLDAGDDVTFKRQVKKGDDAMQTAFTLLAGMRVPWFFDDHLVVYGGLLESAFGAGFRFEWDFNGYPLWVTMEGRPSHSSLGGEDLDEEIDGPLLRTYLTAPLWTPGDQDFASVVLGSMRVHAGVSNLLDEPEFMAGMGVYWADRDLKTLVGLVGLGR